VKDPSSSRPEAGVPSRGSTLASGYLLGWGGFLFFTAILVLAVWYGREGLAVLASLMLAAAFLSRVWNRLSLAGVRGRLLLAERRAFPGERIAGRLRLVNRKPLPLPWIELEQALPAGLVPSAPGETGGNGTLRFAAAMRWYQAVQWRIGFDCTRRGYYRLPPMRVTSGDPFGFYTRSALLPSEAPVLVYPRLIALDRIGIPSFFPAGDERSESRLFPDPTRAVGVRDYRPGDPLRAIHWKASARQRRLQVKVFESATTRRIAFFVAADSFDGKKAGPEGDFEFALSVVASLAHDSAGRGASVGLYVNARLADTGQPASLVPGGGRERLVAALELLAKVTSAPNGPFVPFLQGELRALGAGTTLVFILSRLPSDLPPLLVELKRAGYPLVLIRIGEGDPTPLPVEVPCYRISRSAGAAAPSAKGAAVDGGNPGGPVASVSAQRQNGPGNGGTAAERGIDAGAAGSDRAAGEEGRR
jgi:uncharacterized protein (DUF58 family)